jgi:hypothetical protein
VEIEDNSELYGYDWEVEVSAEIARRWQAVMADYHQVQEEMRQAMRDNRAKKAAGDLLNQIVTFGYWVIAISCLLIAPHTGMLTFN